MCELRLNLLRFFDRPTEPCFMPKGDDKTVFQIPDHYYPEHFKKCTDFVPSDCRTIKIQDITLPDLSLPLQLPRDGQFSFFVTKHRDMASRLIDVFMKAENCEELQSICAYCQLHANPYLFNYCLSVAILHRNDTKGMDIPTFAETFPDMFVERKTLHRAREYCSVLPDGTPCPNIEIPLRTPKIPEQRMEYFREDIGVNSHHWHWHLIYPTDANTDEIVKKDRRGELFYYMHHQIMARYNVERLCNGLERTKPYVNFREPIAEGYFPRMDSKNSNHTWAPRYDNMTPHDVDRPGTKSLVKISDMERWRENILTAIKDMAVLNVETDKSQPLDEVTGIDVLANIVEATSISVNPEHYGDYHNQGHMLIAFVHDPDEYHSDSTTVMGESGTAMRDPVFYRVHANIDELFTMFKDNLPPYGIEKLDFFNVKVSSISIKSADEQDINNTISTLWERSKMNLRNGLDFAKPRNVFAQFTHLQHEEFKYVIDVNNMTGKAQMGTVRIFMAPLTDQDGLPLSFDEQRLLMIEMDKFSYPLQPGANTIKRASADSSVTIAFERIFRDHSDEPDSSKPLKPRFCDCGWPQYLLVPKGTTEGFPVKFFVMISDWSEDKVDQDRTGALDDNASYCGLRDQKYPDRQAMGYPFDRKTHPEVESLEQFLQPNMAVANCTIKFTDTTRDRVPKRKQKVEPADNDNSPDQPQAPGQDAESGRCGWPRPCHQNRSCHREGGGNGMGHHHNHGQHHGGGHHYL